MLSGSEGVLEQLLTEVKGMRTDIQEFDKRVASLEQDRVRAQKVQDRVFGGVFAVIGVVLLAVAGGFSDYVSVKNRLQGIEIYGSPKARELESRVQKLEARR